MAEKHPKELRVCAECGRKFLTRKYRCSRFCSPKCKGKHAAREASKQYIGQRFGRLVVLKELNRPKSGGRLYDCICDCGTHTAVLSSNLLSGHTQSCGCLGKQKRTASATTHGQSNTRLYEVWQGMLSRCEKEYSTVYSFYGGRGIRVCNDWHCFEPFYAWATKNGYADDLTLDRIDPDGNYEPSNCRWATRTEQANNKRTSRLICVDGVFKTQSEWAKIIGVSHGAIIQARKRGVDIADYIRARL